MAVRLQIPTAEVFMPLLEPARYKGAHGGRGSGKSHFFGGLAVEDALRFPGDHGAGLRMVCAREIQKSLKFSAKSLIEAKLQQFGLGEQQGFKVFREVIELPHDGVMIFQGMQDHTADSVKSLEDFHRFWGEEAQSFSDRSMTLIRPTIRSDLSELWFSWNPDLPTCAVDQMLRSDRTPTGAKVVQANWSDNPWLPKVLNQERLDCIENEPEKYGHIWNGEYATVLEGAYYSKHLTEAALQNRIGFVAPEPLVAQYAVFDIGGTSGRSDATSIWVVQFVGTEVRVLDYYEAVGQPFDAHVNWLRGNGYTEATCVLPHDGRKHDTVYAVTPEGFLRTAGFSVMTVPNQGKGAALQRVEATRMMFPRVRFNEETTKGGREALGWYHEKRDEKRNIGLGPNHDWASHGADAFGLIAIFAQTIGDGVKREPLRRGLKGIA